MTRTVLRLYLRSPESVGTAVRSISQNGWSPFYTDPRPVLSPGKERFDDPFRSEQSLRRVNLNACQKVTDRGISGLVSASPSLEALSVYWNLK